ncbi:hypothetical protein CDAR_46681 [Caerostris darwini]|uniref:Uncharacterized protein n=1 Tax=Caerostris darwini TaxID=1538125 RepID=A0AAV4U5E2_9ARAC|nr:hypothetical protein CDAR_46681 [Caerostris darwini]
MDKPYYYNFRLLLCFIGVQLVCKYVETLFPRSLLLLCFIGVQLVCKHVEHLFPRCLFVLFYYYGRFVSG